MTKKMLKNTPGSEIVSSADDTVYLTIINQDLRQAYGKFTKLKGLSFVLMI